MWKHATMQSQARENPSTGTRIPRTQAASQSRIKSWYIALARPTSTAVTTFEKRHTYCCCVDLLFVCSQTSYRFSNHLLESNLASLVRSQHSRST